MYDKMDVLYEYHKTRKGQELPRPTPMRVRVFLQNSPLVSYKMAQSLHCKAFIWNKNVTPLAAS